MLNLFQHPWCGLDLPAQDKRGGSLCILHHAPAQTAGWMLKQVQHDDVPMRQRQGAFPISPHFR
jgi:hypothetical protein